MAQIWKQSSQTSSYWRDESTPRPKFHNERTMMTKKARAATIKLSTQPRIIFLEKFSSGFSHSEFHLNGRKPKKSPKMKPCFINSSVAWLSNILAFTILPCSPLISVLTMNILCRYKVAQAVSETMYSDQRLYWLWRRSIQNFHIDLWISFPLWAEIFPLVLHNNLCNGRIFEIRSDEYWHWANSLSRNSI